MKYIIDLHTHSIAGGHAYSTFQENVAAAYAKGLSVYGFSEHAPAMPGGPHPYFFENFKVLPDEYKGMRVLKGCEANIIDLEGHFDLDDSVLARMDYVIASMMPSLNLSPRAKAACFAQILKILRESRLSHALK